MRFNEARFDWFLRKAGYFLAQEHFDDSERLYKVALAAKFRRVAESLREGHGGVLDLFLQAVRSKENNLMNWRDTAELGAWCKTAPDEVRRFLADLWGESEPSIERLESASATLANAGISQPAAQLTVVSTLLMAISPFDHPPVRTQPFVRLFKELGVEGFSSSEPLSVRYRSALEILDRIMEAAPGVFQDRLDVQGVLWCIHADEWAEAIPAGPEPDPVESAVDEAVLRAHPEWRGLPETMRLRLCRSRNGQGWFREQLWLTWDGCSVTDCKVRELVEAVHIKPWTECTDNEKLDPASGLLLQSTLHKGFNAGLISFRDDGRVRVSKKLPAGELEKIGLNRRARLRPPLSTEAARFLSEHRKSKFRP